MTTADRWGAGGGRSDADDRPVVGDQVPIAERIICVDCGDEAGLISHTDPPGMAPVGSIVAYRCRSCLERWDIQVDSDGI